MEALFDIVTPAPKKRVRYAKYSAERMKRRFDRLSFKAIDCLEEILADSSAKPADRIAAAKLSFEAALRQGGPSSDEDGIVRVVFEGSPAEYAE